MTHSLRILSILFLLSLTISARAEEIVCRYCADAHARLWGPQALDLEGRYHYAPDRQVDVQHIRLDVTPDFDQRTVTGVVSITASPIVKPLEVLRLDATDIRVDSIRGDGAQVADFTSTRSDLQVAFVKPIPAGSTFTVHIAYSAEPNAGLYFRTAAMGYPAADTHLWTQGEAHEARHWFPCFDYPNERATSEIICHVPKAMTVLSNGRRVGEEVDDQGRKTVHWLQDQSQPTYLICLVAGYFEKLEDRHRDVPLGYYVQPTLAEHAANSFRDTADIMAFYEEEIGVPFPWNKYDQVTIRDFVAGGMENTTLTTLTHRTIFSNATENIRTSRHLDAHEMAHQWFGDLVTCKDWSHLWLNEGFATYYTHLYEGHKFGRDALLYGLYRDASNRVLTQQDDKKPVVYNEYKNAMEQFDYRSYPKGSWVLHMLRSQLGEDLYRKCIKTYLEQHALTSVVTDDLRQVIERLSGRPMDRFFDQWLYHPRHPDLKVSYRWLMPQRMAKVTIQQTQKVDDDVMLYQFPTKLRFLVKGQVVDHEIEIKEAKSDFYVPLAAQPAIVRFDPDYTVLADVSFDKPNAMLKAQIENRDDMMGRLFACKALADRKTHESVSLLETALNEDSFYGVRITAAESLAKHDSDEAYAALEQSWREQADARVRLAVVEKVANRFSSGTPERIARILAEERNPAIQAAAIKALGRFHGFETRKLLVKYLGSESFGNELALAAISAIRQLKDADYGDDLMATLTEHASRFDSRGVAQGLESLADVTTTSDSKDSVREFLLGYLNHPQITVRASAIRALGTLGDPKAISVLETVAESGDKRIADAATQSLAKLRESKPAAPLEVIELRKELAGLKKETEKLQTELKEVQGQLKARDSEAN